MIKGEQTLELAYDYDKAKVTVNGAFENNDIWRAYSIGYIPASMIANSHMYSGAEYVAEVTNIGTRQCECNIRKSGGVEIEVDRGVPFCYAFGSTNELNCGQFQDENGNFGACKTNFFVTSNNNGSGLAPMTQNPIAYLLQEIHIDDTTDSANITLQINFQIQNLLCNEDGSYIYSSQINFNGRTGQSIQLNYNGDEVRDILNGTDKTITYNYNLMYPGESAYRQITRSFNLSDWANSDGTIFDVIYDGTSNTYEHIAITCIGIRVLSAINILETSGFSQVSGIAFPFGSRFRQASVVGANGAYSLNLGFGNNNYVPVTIGNGGTATSSLTYYRHSTANADSDFIYNYTVPCENMRLRNDGFFISASNNDEFYLFFHGYTFTDLKICICTSSPLYAFSDGLYVAEFNDNYEITGRLIPFENAKEWQKDLTPDTNTFDTNSIPESGGGGDDDIEEEGDRISPQYRQIGTAGNFVTQYGMTSEQVANFGKLLWTSWADSGGTLTAFWKNFFFTLSPNQDTGSYNIGDVLDFVVSLRVYPFSLSNLRYTSSSGSQNVYIGTGQEGLACGGGTNLLSINSTVDYIQCGSVKVPRTYNDFRDYENTVITAYLPYCGTVELSPGDVIGKSLTCHYAIDMQSGQCTAFITSSDDSGVLYPVAQKDGEIGFMIPLTATNSGQLASQKIQNAKNVAETISGIIWDTATSGQRNISGINNEASAITAGLNTFTNNVANVGSGISTLAQQTINRFNRSAIDCPSLSGGSGFASFGTPSTAYIQIRHGIYKNPDNYSHTVGKVSTKSGTLSSFSGFTKCINPDLSGISCTVAEKSEISKLLESGVYV